MNERLSKLGCMILICILAAIVSIGCGGGDVGGTEKENPAIPSHLVATPSSGGGGDVGRGKAIPKIPSSLVAIPPSTTQISLCWSDNSNNETGFKVERKTGVDGTWGEIGTVGANVTSYPSTGLTAATNYFYRVRAYSGAGDSIFSNETSAQTPLPGRSSKTVPPGMSTIPAGCFSMGDTFGEGGSDELPVHIVYLPAFNIDVHEVTNAEYAACVNGGRCTAPGSLFSGTRDSYYGNETYSNFPVIYISWDQATAYCSWANKRLPTEAEWEYAARGGLSGKRYPWGDSISGKDANFLNSGDPWDNDTTPVKFYAANGYGLYDMAGNAWEWVNDWYAEDYYTGRPNPDNDPPGPNTGKYRVVRGGSRSNITYFLRVSLRDTSEPWSQGGNFGFRCAGD